MEVSIVHLYLQGMMKKKVNGGNIISKSDINPILRWHVRIPRKYQNILLNEMTKTNLLKRIKRDDFEIVSPEKKKNLTNSLGEPLW